MSSIKAVLLDAERQKHQNEKLRLCMWKLRDIFYDAEDVVDDFRCETLRKQLVDHPNISFKVRFLASCSLPLSFSLRMGHRIKCINQRLNELATEWNSFNLGQLSDNRHVFHRETQSFVNSSDVFGRDEDKENIVDFLMKPSEDQNIPVFPVVGIGGLGKTTLVQLVYNDDRVTRLFPLKLWICVSDDFDLPRLLKLMILSINKEEKCDGVTVEALRTCLRSLLDDKKFLLVLDDVWNENRARWIEFRDLLRSMVGLSQSKIIVTTRSLKVASTMSSFHPYELTGLRHEDCLILFTKWAFDDGAERQHPNLMRIGEEIVRKCKGVPLAVRTLGSLLFLKTDESYWISIRDSEIWRLEQTENDILPVLKLSYNHLPSDLQQCLAFFSLYRKDTVYYSDQVVHSWMANGLLEHRKQNQQPEDVGYQYLNELQSRCFIQKEEDYDLYFTFKMHDLIHDLTLDVAQKECQTVNCRTETIHSNVRHLSFCDVKLEKVPQVLKNLKDVRTVIVQEVSRESKIFHESLINLCVSNFKHLRALSLCNSPLEALPNSIGTLKHLRDFDLERFYNIRKLPSSFHKLWSLQTLRMYNVPLVQLPENMESLIELRYLEVTVKSKHFKAIQPGCWTSLQCLELLSCENLECLPEGMQYLTSLRKLVLYSCLNLVSLPQSLKFLTKLEDLRVSCCDKINLQMEAEEEGDEDLQLNLKTFAVWQLNVFTDLPRLLLERSSSTLREIRIENCYRFAVLPDWVKGLTSLHKLEVINCPQLSTVPEGIDRLAELRELNIRQKIGRIRRE